MLTLVAGTAHAQPAPNAPDFAHATELYNAATTAMTEGRYLDAARGFDAAYDITRDPVLFYKIGVANEKAGKCEIAVIYYGRYLREARPEPRFIEMTQARITACGATTDTTTAPVEPDHPAITPTPTPSPSPSPAPTPVVDRQHHDAAWLMVGGAVAFVTLGAVLAYAASSSEADITDLYVGVTGTRPTYDPTTAKLYQDLIDEGHHYEYLSWAAFGVATGCAATATVLFLRGDHQADRVSVTPIVMPHESGVAATFRF